MVIDTSAKDKMLVKMIAIPVEQVESEKKEFVIPDSIRYLLHVETRIKGVQWSIVTKAETDFANQIGRGIYRGYGNLTNDQINASKDLELERLLAIRDQLVKALSKDHRKWYNEIKKAVPEELDLEAIAEQMESNKDKPAI